jgi:type VI secretion system protein ImpG
VLCATDVLLQLNEAGGEAELFSNKQLLVEALCTNRDLSLLLGRDRHGCLTLSSGAPVDNVRCLAVPSAPCSLPVDGDTAWRLLMYLSVN